MTIATARKARPLTAAPATAPRPPAAAGRGPATADACRPGVPAGGRPRRRRVLLAMEWLDYELNLGIAEYARRVGWTVDDMVTHTGQVPRGWAGDGVIALLRNRDSDLTRFVCGTRRPVVDLVDELTDLPIPPRAGRQRRHRSHGG